MHFLAEYSIFLAKIVTLVIAVLIVTAGVIAIASKDKDKTKDKIKIKKLNKKYAEMARTLKKAIFSKRELRQQAKVEKKAKKTAKTKKAQRKRIFVLRFSGDIKASQVASLRQEISAILSVASKQDEVVLLLESAGGLVHSYGLAASQLERIRQQHIRLTIIIDKVAASGGYLMACVGDRILAAPFAIIGSIGVIAQIPNFHRLLKKKDIDFEQITAGEFKRTLTVFGENTDKARKKFKQDIEDIHNVFKEFIQQNRPKVELAKVATGEHWLAKRALALNLVDELLTSDDYLRKSSQTADLYQVTYKKKKGLSEKLAKNLQLMFDSITQSKQRQAQIDNIV